MRKNREREENQEEKKEERRGEKKIMTNETQKKDAM